MSGIDVDCSYSLLTDESDPVAASQPVYPRLAQQPSAPQLPPPQVPQVPCQQATQLEALQRQMQDMQKLLAKLQPAPAPVLAPLPLPPSRITVSMDVTPADFSTAVHAKDWIKATEMLPHVSVLSKDLLYRIFVGDDPKLRSCDVTLQKGPSLSRLALWRAVLERSKITPEQVNQLYGYASFSTCTLILAFGDASMHQWLSSNSSPEFMDKIVSGSYNGDDLVAWTAYTCNAQALEFLFHLKTAAGKKAFPRIGLSTSWRLSKFSAEICRKDANGNAAKDCIAFWVKHVAPELFP